MTLDGTVFSKNGNVTGGAHALLSFNRLFAHDCLLALQTGQGKHHAAAKRFNDKDVQKRQKERDAKLAVRSPVPADLAVCSTEHLQELVSLEQEVYSHEHEAAMVAHVSSASLFAAESFTTG